MSNERWPLLTELFAPQLDSMEAVIARGRAGKHAGDPNMAREKADKNYSKAGGHHDQAGPLLDAVDRETGASHVLLAALREMMVDKCLRGQG